MTNFRLRLLPWSVRVGIAMLMLVCAGGLAASWMHIWMHHGQRDETPGVSYTDIAGAYHGVKVTAPLMRAVERGHPEGLPSAEQAALKKWMEGTRVTEDYDNTDLGDMAPSEIIARSCLECHARAKAALQPVAAKIPLEYFDDVRKVAVSREVKPMEKRILVMTTHTHALAMVPLTVVVGGLMLMTGWWRWVARGLVVVACAGLLVDVGAWWVAREWLPGVWGVIVGGGMYSGAMAVMVVGVIADVLRPEKGVAK